MEIENAASVANDLGEGPVWHQAEQRLYWVDATNNSYLIFDPATRTVEHHDIGRYIISIAFCNDAKLLIATDSELIYWNPDSVITEYIITGRFDSNVIRFNDGKVDPAGRYFIGTKHCEENKPLGGLYRLTAHGDFSQVEWNITTSNGLGWNPDELAFYYTDSMRKAIYRYDYDKDSGAISNRKILVDSQDEEGVPDGLAVDAEGCIWSARWNGWKVTRYDPDGKRMLEMPIPVAKPTSCAFGGPDLRDLYITSARYGLDEAHLRNHPDSGNLFVCHTDIKGQIENSFR